MPGTPQKLPLPSCGERLPVGAAGGADGALGALLQLALLVFYWQTTGALPTPYWRPMASCQQWMKFLFFFLFSNFFISATEIGILPHEALSFSRCWCPKMCLLH